jgi:seryl-tRNA synthetase
MLDIKYVRENPDLVRDAIVKKGLNVDLDQVLELDVSSRGLNARLQTLQAERNAMSRRTGPAPVGDGGQREAAREIGERVSVLKQELADVTDKLRALQLLLPTSPAADAPIGPDADSNVVVRTWGDPPPPDPRRDHVDIATANNWLDLKRVAKISGSRSYIVKNDLLRLEMALHAAALDRLSADGFTIMSAPALVKEECLVGTGHFPAGREDIYDLPRDGLFLAGTAEVAINSLYAGETLDHSELPLLFAGISPCFRREAGSAGRDVRGLLRVHQFWKVEQFVFCEADVAASDALHVRILENAESLMRDLQLPYRVVACSTGDMGAGKYRMHDIEAWMPSLNTYRETHSCSSLLDWQSRRTNTRYKDRSGALRFPYTLNNTAIATPRVLAAFLEIHWRPDGSVAIPSYLQKFMHGATKIEGKSRL